MLPLVLAREAFAFQDLRHPGAPAAGRLLWRLQVSLAAHDVREPRNFLPRGLTARAGGQCTQQREQQGFQEGIHGVVVGVVPTADPGAYI